MRITRLSWTNYKGLADGAIDADGSDVTISGRNGVGKSTIAEMILFVLFGLGKGESIKPFEGGRVQHDSELVHGAQIIFDDGTTLSRKIGGNTEGFRYFVNGKRKSAGEFNNLVSNITHGGGELVINPFYFHDDKKFSKEERRDLLLKMFGVKESDLLTPDEITLLDGQTADEFIDTAKSELKSLKRDADKIPARIDELAMRLAKPPVDHTAEIKQIESQIARLEVDISELETARDKLNQSAATNIKAEYDSIMRQADTLKQTIARNERELGRKKNQCQNLRDEWLKVNRSEPGFCPTCKQKMPETQFKDAKEKRLDEIKNEGTALKTDIESLTALIESDNKTLLELEQRAGELSTAANEQSANENNRRERLAEVKRAIADNQSKMNKLRDALAGRKAEMKTDADNRAADTKRMNELQAELKELNKKIAKLEVDINAAKFIRQRIVDTLEEKINSHFDSVKFKLFNVVASTGEVKPACETVMHDVPYSSLSKGEKFKCALETFKVIQAYYKTEMPLIIDDAESYTFEIDLPNQKWLFKVTGDDKLVIEVQKARLAA